MRRYGLLGKNIDYSFSRGYFKSKFERLGITDSTYENFDLEDLSEFPELLRENRDIAGLNVTIPYKEAIIPYLDSLDPVALAIGAVNTICFRPGGLRGYNTDVIGFRDSLSPHLQETDKEALVLGTGGASKAVVYALEELGIASVQVSRRPGGERITYKDLDADRMQRSRIIVNCTPLGTYPDTEAAPDLPYQQLGPDHLLFDLIYNPAETTFLKRGKARGARVLNGLEMLELQAEASWELWNKS